MNEYYVEISKNDENNFEKHYLVFDLISRAEGTFIPADKLFKLYLRFCEDFGYKNKFSRAAFTKNMKFIGYENKAIKFEKKTIRAFNLGENKNEN